MMRCDKQSEQHQNGHANQDDEEHHRLHPSDRKAAPVKFNFYSHLSALMMIELRL